MLKIDVVDPDPAVAHEHLARRGRGLRALDHHEFFGPAMTGDLDCEHP
jgi:hypothetical protein